MRISFVWPWPEKTIVHEAAIIGAEIDLDGIEALDPSRRHGRGLVVAAESDVDARSSILTVEIADES